MKIQPIDFHAPPAKTEVKSRLKRIFERQFTPITLKIPATAMPEKSEGSEPSSVCLARMVQSFIEGNVITERQLFEDDSTKPLAMNSVQGGEVLKSLVLCSSVSERNLLAETARIVEKNSKIFKRKDGIFRNVIADGLSALGYDASICKSRWEKSHSCPAAGEYEYIDVIVEGERLIIDVDFRSEFEIARPTKAYKAIVQSLPSIYVGKSERLQRVVSVVSDAAKQSLEKRGMPVPPWRKREYVGSKWLSPHARVGGTTRHSLGFRENEDCEVQT